MTRYGMAIDMDRCIGCQTCTVSCQLNNALRPGSARLCVDALEWGRWPDADRAFLPHACLHCDEPLCASVCPIGASRRRDDGIVVVDQDLCIGCSVCVTACEYGARTVNRGGGFHFGAKEPAPYEAEGIRHAGVADKCDFCAELHGRGSGPACVRDCVVGARAFGDLDDPGSDVNAFIAARSCERVAGTALYYARGTRDVDVKAHLAASSFISAKEEGARQEAVAEGSFDPVVVGAAGAAAVAVAAGLGASARSSRVRRKRDGASRRKGG